MPSKHTVQQGESLYTIAKQHGFLNWRTIYDAPENEDLRNQRPNAQVLQPGDIIVIPDNNDAALGVPLNTRTVVAKRKSGLQPLRLHLNNADGKPVANQDYRLTFEGGELRGKTNGNGQVLEEIPVGVVNVRLEVGKTSHTLLVGFLNPLEDSSDGGIAGVQGRLKNLGFYDGPVDGKANPQMDSAIRSFQSDNDLPETGEADEETVARLLEVHGS
jgi:hypothetical protein